MRVLLVSKPLCPPWHDSGKNWARDVATYGGGDGIVHHVLVPRGSDAWAHREDVVAEAIYAGDGSFAPRWADNARAFGRLARRWGPCDVVHFCFAPNKRTNRLARWAMGWRRQPSVHTVLSVPVDFDQIDRVLFAERVVCVSRATADRLKAEGVAQVSVVPASIPVPERRLSEAAPARLSAIAEQCGLSSGRPLVVFPGDYEFSQAADVFAGAIEAIWRDVEADFVFACRIKRPDSLQREASMRARLSAQASAGRVHFVREVSDMAALLSLASVVTLPAESTYAKMDIPLVLLEAMAEGTPVVLADVAPLRETLGQGDPGDAGGLLVPPLDSGALAASLKSLLDDPAAARQLGERGRAHVQAHHDAARTCRRYADIYRSLGV